jgi:excisionase family DNA binding protein
MAMITVKEASDRLGVTRFAVNQAIIRKRLPAQRFGRAWKLREKDVEHYRVTRRFAEKRMEQEQ